MVLEAEGKKVFQLGKVDLQALFPGLEVLLATVNPRL